MNVNADPKTQEEMGKKFRTARENKGLSQEQVADKAGISITYYAGIERGEENPSLAVIKGICKVLNIRSTQILHF
ncbi:MAG TPA: helix-turn-helix domain-containing protein [Candidatus Wunengus sp. YC60]|uniref:helix-turn-helix domain-containing protein n=1 Tax=Candidatus Wunengus sp. YC60 TaxID=3367697 RepID=UPI004025AB1A